MISDKIQKQTDIFDFMYERFKFDKPIKLMELFSGIGFQSMGMDLAEIPHTITGTSEIDKFAMLSYAAIHTDYLNIRDTYKFPNKETMVKHLQDRNIGFNFDTNKHSINFSTNEETVKDYYLAATLNKNYGDVSKIAGKNINDNIDILTYSFPCQDLSNAGQRAGLQGGTRSGLVYEVLRLLKELHKENNLPKVLIMENVIDLIQTKFVGEWNKIAKEIEDLGYSNYTEVLNGVDYGIAQNRQRVFMVSILGDYNYNFPSPVELKYRLKDYLENVVDESLYLSDKKIANYREWNSQGRPLKNVRGQKSIVPTITARSQGDDHGQTILLHGGDDNINVDKPSIPIPEATIKGFAEAYEGDGVYHNRPYQKRGVVQDGMIPTLKANNRDVGVVVKAVAQRGRYNDNGVIEQQFEAGEDISNALTTVQKDMMVVEGKPEIINPLKNKTDKGWHFEQAVYDEKGILRAIKAGGGSGNIPKVIAENEYVGTFDHKSSDNFIGDGSRFKLDEEVAGTIITGPREGVVINAKRQLTNAMLESGKYEEYDMINHGYIGDRSKNIGRKESENNISATLTTRPDTLGVVEPTEKYLRIRKLTPRETGRLMGMQDYQFDKQIQVASNAQAYKQHGNGIIAQVIGMIIGMMWYESELELRETVMNNSHSWIKKGE